MHRTPGFCLALLAAATLSICANQAMAKDPGWNVTTHGDVNSCDDLHFQLDDQEPVRAEQRFTLPRTSAPLDVTASHNGGVTVTASDGNEFSITACKAAVNEDSLRRISVSAQGGSVSVQGSDEHAWTVYLIIQAPRDAALVLKTVNGPIGLRGLTGNMQAHSTNGPISLKQCSGEIDARTDNGPVGFSGSGGGNVRLESRNGPITVALSGSQWSSGGLTAQTENGPVSLRVPANYASGVRVESAGRSPMECRAAQCSGAQRTWDERRRYIEFGGSAIAVRMSTVNGPVTVNSERDETD